MAVSRVFFSHYLFVYLLLFIFFGGRGGGGGVKWPQIFITEALCPTTGYPRLVRLNGSRAKPRSLGRDFIV